jgi:hypothetical protein
MTAMTICCSNCRFFNTDDRVGGECRRYAPKPITIVETENQHDNALLFWPTYAQPVWPFVSEEDSCGEFQPLKETT